MIISAPTRRIAALLALVFALALASAAQAREWLRAELPGVVLYSDGYPHELQRWALKVRLFDALLRDRLGDQSLPDEPGSPLTIYLLDEGSDVERLTGRTNITGLYSPSSEGSYLIASRALGYDREQLSGQMVLFHEYAHHFMYRHLIAAYPAWYREGYAEFAGAIAFDADWNAKVGQPAWPRMKHLDGKPMPLATLLDASVDDFKPDEKARFYAWSWKLVHLLNREPVDRQRLDRYLALFSSGMASRDAAQAAFGDLAALEMRLHAYVPDPRGGETVKAALAPLADATVAVLDPVSARLIDLRLGRLAGRDPEKVLAALRGFVAANPANAEARRELAIAERDAAPGKTAHGLDDAAQQAEAALLLAPSDVRTLALVSDIAFRRLKANPTATPADWEAARAKLAQAVDAGTNDPLALATLFRSYLSEPRQPPPAVHAAMERAFALQPESYEIRFLDIYSLAMQGRVAEARRAARVLASDPHAAAMGKRALASLDRITAGKAPACTPTQSGETPC